MLLKRVQISLHDVYMVHGSKEDNSPNSRWAMTMRFMPLSSEFDHQLIFDSKPSFKIIKIYPVRSKMSGAPTRSRTANLLITN